MNKKSYSIIPFGSIFFLLLAYLYNKITLDTYYIGLSILLSSFAIILALAKNDDDRKNKK